MNDPVLLGAQVERIRLARAIGEFPLTPCECSRWTVELGWHSPDCAFDAEFRFRQRLINALFPTTGEGADGSGDVSPRLGTPAPSPAAGAWTPIQEATG